MKLTTLGDIIACRKLTLSEEDEHREVVVLIGKPQPFKDSGDFYCPFQIRGLGHARINYAGGVDAIQALELALQKIGVILQTSEAARAGRLRWEAGEGNDLGFPVPASLKGSDPKSGD